MEQTTAFEDGSSVRLFMTEHGLLGLEVGADGPVARKTVDYMTNGTGELGSPSTEFSRLSNLMGVWKEEQDSKWRRGELHL
jgi:hypothetical protein